MGARIDQITNSFCLGYVQLAVQYCTPRELAGKGLPCPGGDERFQQQRRHIVPAVT